MLINTDKIIHELALRYNLKDRVAKTIVTHPFKVLKSNITSNSIIPVRFKYFGVFHMKQFTNKITTANNIIPILLRLHKKSLLKLYTPLTLDKCVNQLESMLIDGKYNEVVDVLRKCKQIEYYESRK